MTIPKRIGKYTIDAFIGEGGMARVFSARHEDSAVADAQGGAVALKLLHAHYSRRGDMLERFKREAALGVQLVHPGIVKVHELIEDGTQIAIVMEKATGHPLSTMIGEQTGPIPWPRAWPLFKQLLDAIEYAHANQVIHRDLKPENIMVDPNQSIKVLDFGIAKETGTGRTQTSTTMGTVDYMAPEQYTDAKRVDVRADVYALGMTLYVMLAGTLPWESSQTDFKVMQTKQLNELPPPTNFYPDIPSKVVQIVMKSLRSTISERYDSIADFREALADTRPQPPPFPNSDPSASENRAMDTPVHLQSLIEEYEQIAKDMRELGIEPMHLAFPRGAKKDIGSQPRLYPLDETFKTSLDGMVYVVDQFRTARRQTMEIRLNQRQGVLTTIATLCTQFNLKPPTIPDGRSLHQWHPSEWGTHVKSQLPSLIEVLSKRLDEIGEPQLGTLRDFGSVDVVSRWLSRHMDLIEQHESRMALAQRIIASQTGKGRNGLQMPDVVTEAWIQKYGTPEVLNPAGNDPAEAVLNRFWIISTQNEETTSLSKTGWLLFGMIWFRAFWSAWGLLLFITIVGRPYGKQIFKHSHEIASPFGKRVYAIPPNPSMIRKGFVLLTMPYGLAVSVFHFGMAIVPCRHNCMDSRRQATSQAHICQHASAGQRAESLARPGPPSSSRTSPPHFSSEAGRFASDPSGAGSASASFFQRKV